MSPASPKLADALKAVEAPSLQGENLRIAFKDGSVRVGEAKLVTADIAASNGLIHIIDQVLLPPAPNDQALTPEALINLAIERGAPQFNHGNPDACIAIYEITVQALRTHPDVSDQTKEDLAATIRSIKTSGSAHNSAWTLRHALDRVIHSSGEQM